MTTAFRSRSSAGGSGTRPSPSLTGCTCTCALKTTTAGGESNSGQRARPNATLGPSRWNHISHSKRHCAANGDVVTQREQQGPSARWSRSDPALERAGPAGLLPVDLARCRRLRPPAPDNPPPTASGEENIRTGYDVKAHCGYGCLCHRPTPRRSLKRHESNGPRRGRRAQSAADAAQSPTQRPIR